MQLQIWKWHHHGPKAPGESSSSGLRSTMGISYHTREVISISRSVMFDSSRPMDCRATRFLCPWNSPGKNTGVGSHSLLQGIFLTQGVNPVSPTLQVDPFPREAPGKPGNHNLNPNGKPRYLFKINKNICP